MANSPQKAKEKRPWAPQRNNAQDKHEGSAHSPEEFDSQNPAKVIGPGTPDAKPDRD